MDYRFILYDKFDGIAKITVNRPEVRNAISTQVYGELDEAFTKAEEDDEVIVIVVAGAGDNFGAGHDIGSKDKPEEKKPPVATKLAEGMRELTKFQWGMRDRQRNISKPTIAMVQGYCIMGSWMLASACDLIIASEDAMFVDRAVRWGGTHVEYFTLFWDIGPRKAKEYLWTGDSIDANEAWRLGMVNKVVPREHLEEETIKLAKRIALNDPFALKLSKSSVNQAMDIMGQSAAMKASFYMFALGYAHFNEIMPDGANVEWAKSKAKDPDD